MGSDRSVRVDPETLDIGNHGEIAYSHSTHNCHVVYSCAVSLEGRNPPKELELKRVRGNLDSKSQG